MKAADVSDAVFLAYVDEHAAAHPEMMGAIYWVMAEELKLPAKIVLAKARSLIKRGLIEGCCCGCRGDFRRPYGYEPTEA
jgi:hypothetical protein